MNRTQDALDALQHTQKAFAVDGWKPTVEGYEALEREYTLEYAKRLAAQEAYVLAIRDRDSWKYTAAGMAVVAALAIAVLALVLVY